MSLHFEAHTLPTSATFEKKFDITDVINGSGVRALSEYSDESLSLPSSSNLIDDIVTDTEGSWIVVKDGTQIVDEFRADRVAIPEARPSVRQISGPQRNGLVEGIAIYPKDWPEDKEVAQDWKWGYDNVFPDLSLGALGSLREEWTLALLGERYQLSLDNATAGTFTLNPDGIGSTAAINFDAEASAIKSALEALAGIDDVSVVATDEQADVPRSYWIVFETPKDLTTDMTLDDSGLTGSATLAKNNDGFDTSTDPTFTITVDGETTQAIDWDASAKDVEGRSETLTPPGSGLQGLSNIDDVAVSGLGTFEDPWVITFYEPPEIGTFSVTFAAGSHQATQVTDGTLDPSPITVSKPINAGSGADAQYGSYGTPPIEVVTSPLDTGATWTLQVNAEERYAGSQLILDVTPGQTYSNVTVPVYPLLTGHYTLVVRDIFENKIKNTNPRDVTLTAGSYQDLTIESLTIPPGVNQIIVRVAVTDADPNNVGVFYTSWETATFFEGEPEATYTQIVRELLDAAHDRGTAEFLELDATDAADSNGTALTPISFAAFFGGNAHLGHVLGDGAQTGYAWRIVDAANAKVITPTGSHVLQIFKATNGEIEDQTSSAGGASVTVGGKLESAETVRRIPPYTTILSHGAGALTREDTDATSESNMGRIERVFDAEPLGTESELGEFNTARFAEESANRKAASAVVLESDSSRPLVDYEEGSKVWWNFGSNLPKEARVVKRIAWAHGNVTRYEVQGSSRLTPEAAMAKAVDYLLNQPVRRRRGEGITGLKASDIAPLSQDHYASTIIVKHVNSTYTGGAHYVCDGVADEVQLLAALNSVDAGGEVVLMDGFYSIDASIQAVLENVEGVGKPVRLIGKGAHLELADGVQIYIQAPTLEIEGFEITRAGTSTNTVIRLAGNDPSELGHIKVSGCKFRDILGTEAVLRFSGYESALAIGNTFSQITISNNGAVVSKTGTGGEGFAAVVGNGFDRISLTGGAGWLFRAGSPNSEGIFVGNSGEDITVTDLARAADFAFAAHNVINRVHEAGSHGTIDHGGLSGLADDDHTQYLLADGSREATFLAIAGLTGATSDSRYVGATASGAPASGTFAVGDYVIAQDGNVYICTTAGSPGTWAQVGAAAATDVDAIHDNVAGEIAAITEKATPVDADLIVIEDSADSNNKKKAQLGNLPGGGGTSDHGALTGLGDDDHTQYLLADGTRQADYIDLAGLTGATSASRYVGATTSGAPASGTFAVGDFVITQDGNVYICTTAGSPGTWTQVGAAAATDADAIHDNVAGEISAITEKATPASGDWLLIEDAADSNNKKKVDWDSLPSGGSGGGGYEDLALGKTYTLDKTPVSTRPEQNIIKNGTAQVGLLTAPGIPFSEEQSFEVGYLAWRRAVELTPDGIVIIRVDLGVAASIGVARVHGRYQTSQQIPHPEALDVEHSDDDSSWTAWGTPLSGMSTDPGSEANALWMLELSDTVASHRYWRFTLEAGDEASGDDWLFVSRVHLLGTR